MVSNYFFILDQDQRSNARKFINGQMPKVGNGLKGQVNKYKNQVHEIKIISQSSNKSMI